MEEAKHETKACQIDDLGESDLGISLRSCYNCSTCTVNCPVALETEGKFNPRTIIQLANCGFEDRLITEGKPEVWDCTMCETCDEVCPQNVKLGEIFVRVKNTAMQHGRIPNNYKDETLQVFECGKAIPSQAAIEKRRKQLGLPDAMAPNMNEIHTIMEETGVKKILTKNDQPPVNENQSV